MNKGDSELDARTREAVEDYAAHWQMPAALEDAIWRRIETTVDTEHDVVAAVPALRSRGTRRWIAVAALAAAALVVVWYGTVVRSEAVEDDASKTPPLAVDQGHVPPQKRERARPKAPADTPATLPGAPALDPVATDDVEPPAPERAPAAIEPARDPKRSPARAKPPAPANEPTAPSLAAELELLQRAQAALAQGRQAEVLRIVRRHAQRFPDSALQEEREALEILARCHDGGDEATRRRAHSFLERHPSSPQAPRVREACTP